MKRLYILLVFCLFFSLTLKAQFSVSGYLSTYYAWDTDKDKTPRQFASFAPISDQFKLDIAQLSASYTSDLVRGLVTLHYGDIPKYNWPADQQMIQQAYMGVQPVKGLWIDAGYFFTHIGAESPLPKDNFFTMYSLGGFFEPFYQSGIRVSYTFSENFSGCFHLINGYNLFEDNNKNKSVGVQLIYTPNQKISFAYNNLIGNEMPNGPGKTRFTNNLVINYYPTDKLSFIGGFDFITQEKSKLTEQDAAGNVISGMVSGRYKVNPKFSISARAEIFNDPEGVLSGTFVNSENSLTGIKSYGFTLGFE